MTVQIKKTDPRALLPKQATEGSAGYDLFALLERDTPVYPGMPIRIRTGISLAMPSREMVGLVYPRSGLATKFGLIPANCVGVIDSDYRGEVMVSLTNLSQDIYILKPFERIAQLVFAPIYLPQFEQVEELGETDRGNGGFGSTGQ